LKSTGKKRPCSVKACARQHYAKGYCKRHYTQISRHGEIRPGRALRVVRICKVERCRRTDTVKGYCRKHARQIQVHGRLTPERERLVGVTGCRIRGCKRRHRAKGYCAKHYNQRFVR
jgi:hypothetical protein